MSWKELFFSFNGRISRTQFWLALAVLTGGGLLITFIILFLPNALKIFGKIIFPIAILLIAWSSLAVSAKRWHDRDKSGWWILISLIPIIGPIWTWVENGFLCGTQGSNRFGSDPLEGTSN
jgi:uncharacterized membrane protein YhaH (DUF805 family)